MEGCTLVFAIAGHYTRNQLPAMFMPRWLHSCICDCGPLHPNQELSPVSPEFS